MKNNHIPGSRFAVVLCVLGMTACSGGGGGTTSPRSFTVGGSLSGLQGAGLVLQDNAANDLSVTSDGSFVFSAPIATGAPYSVSVKAQPTNVWQTCAVTNGSGTVSTSNVTSVSVACVTNKYSISGAVTNLVGAGLRIADQGTSLAAESEWIIISYGLPGATSTFVFTLKLPSGEPYDFEITDQPAGPNQTCALDNKTGTVLGAAITNLAVTCVTNTYSVGGTVSGLVGSGLVLQDNAGDNFPITSNGAFTFPAKVASGDNYAVTVLTQPGGPSQVCSVSSGGGTVTDSAVTSVVVSCAAPVASCGTPNGTVVQHANNIAADETWAGAGTVHVVTASISIMAPATLTLQPCAIVQLKGGVQIIVHGGSSAGSVATLLAAGNDPTSGVVYFTNADANSPWGSLEGLNANSHIQLNFVHLSGGGATSAGTRNATIEMHGTSNSTLPDPVLKVNTTSIMQMQGAGVYLDNAAFTPDSQLLSISGSPDYAMALSAMALGSIPTYLSSGNAHDEALVVGNANVFADLTIHKRLPIHFHSSAVRVAGGPPSFTPTVTLTLDHGVELRFENVSTTPTLVTFGTNGQTSDQNGVLIANGTALDPILFTSALDSPTTSDYWAGFWLLTSNGSQLSNVIFEYAGADAAIGPINCGPFDPSINQQARHTAPLLIGDGTDQQYVPPANLITGSVFRNNIGNFAIDSVWENPGRTFGPSLHNDNVFTSPGKFCPQSKNLIPLGCTINGQDESGCQ
jgi:hypothetical protein